MYFSEHDKKGAKLKHDIFILSNNRTSKTETVIYLLIPCDLGTHWLSAM